MVIGVRSFSPSMIAAIAGGVATALVCGFLQAQGVALDVDVATVVGDLLGIELEAVNISVRQAVTGAVAAALGWLWPDERHDEDLAGGAHPDWLEAEVEHLEGR